MDARYGPERTAQILGMARHNTVYYPNLTIKGAIQSIRVVKPIAVDKTLVESWTFRLKGAPPELLQRTSQVLFSGRNQGPTSSYTDYVWAKLTPLSAEPETGPSLDLTSLAYFGTDRAFVNRRLTYIDTFVDGAAMTSRPV